MCLKKTPTGAPADMSAEPWTLAYGDDTTVEPTVATAESFSVPLYPQISKNIAVGDCVRGTIVYEVPKDRRPTRTVYMPTDDASGSRPLRWAIG